MVVCDMESWMSPKIAKRGAYIEVLELEHTSDMPRRERTRTQMGGQRNMLLKRPGG